MSDLVHALPTFDTTPYSHLLHSIEKNDITVADLLTLDPLEIARRCPLPLLEVKRLVKDIILACQIDAGIALPPQNATTSDALLPSSSRSGGHPHNEHTNTTPHIIRTLDPLLDAALSGGIHTGYLTEISGESSCGKTQLCLSLLLSAQLPPPHGLSRSSIYISTESPLNTTRLHQILSTHPLYTSLSPTTPLPSLNNIHTLPVTDLESQDHILTFQLPLAIRRFSAGLVIIDSVAANYRAEHSTSSSSGLADRAAELAKLGSLLRRLATEENVAVILTNQVADRFDDYSGGPTQELRGTGVGSSSPGGTPHPHPHLDTIMSLDYQSRFFTGWGNKRPMQHNQYQREELKTPALGLAWANQIAARVVLKMEGERQFLTSGTSQAADALGGNLYHDRRKRRFMHVVFCPWAAPTEGRGVEYRIEAGGVVGVRDEVGELLDERLWVDGVDEGEAEEYPL
jgi:DNA repair protein RAD57